MRVFVNDAAVDLDGDVTIADLLTRLGFPDTGIAVAVNQAVLPRSRWCSTVPDGARVEIVTAVQGG